MYKRKSAKSVRKQPYSDIPAKQRAFSLKSGYMTSLLRKYILGDEKVESIIKDKFEVGDKSIEDIVYNKFKPYFNCTIENYVKILILQLIIVKVKLSYSFSNFKFKR